MYKRYEDSIDLLRVGLLRPIGYDHPMDWLAFASEIDALWSLQDNFESVSLHHIPQSENGWADQLVKEARARGFIISHRYQSQTDRSAPKRSVSSDQTWSN